MGSRMLKRVMDVLGAVMGMLVTAPLMLLLALVIRLSLGSPVLFRQLRPGLHGKPFTVYKFRTMLDVRDAQGALLPDEQRLTAVGRFLRRTSLDELPELFNVLKGEMSLVGPRPLLMKYLPYYTVREQLRHSVKPGITGLAQISGRNALPWDERLALDVFYVENWSLWLDIKILVITVWRVLSGSGIHLAPRLTTRDLDLERGNQESIST